MLFNRVLAGAASAVALLSATVSAYANPGACSGECWTHDPVVIRRESDGVYFRFNTGSKIGILKSDSLEGPWVYQGAALPDGSSIPLAGNDDLWAPDVHLVGSTYVLFYSVSTFGSQDSAIGYATSATMEAGSWTDHGATGVSSAAGSAYNAIDGNLVQDAAGGYHLTFGSFWTDLFQVAMDASGTAVASGAAPANVAFNGSGAHAVEGAFVHPRDAWFYLFFSAGTCCGFDQDRPAAGDEYKVFVCRSQAVAGPYVDAAGRACTDGGGTLVLPSHDTVYGPGGQGVFTDPDHGTVLYYHYVDTTVGYADGDKKFGWNVLNWSGGWPSV